MLIAITAALPQLYDAAQILAKKYGLPYTEIDKKENFDFIFILEESGLFLQASKKNNCCGNIQINFLQGRIAYRLRLLQNQTQLIAKAVGPKIKTVLDLTAGLGWDGFILAQLGFSVTLLERSPIIAMLLEDGLTRAAQQKKFAALNIKLLHTDAFIYLKYLRIHDFPEVIYLDPMYPRDKKSALAKKEMYFLRQIVGGDLDAENLLPLALTRAKKRVVVKRPRIAPYLGSIKPAFCVVGKQLRFDVYLGCVGN